MNSHTLPQPDSGLTPALVGKVMFRFLAMMLLMLAVLLLSAGRFAWWEAWAYAGSSLLVLAVSRGFMLWKHPDMAQERAEAGQKENVKSWDRILMPFVAVYGPLISWVLAGLDVRYGWSPDLPNGIQLAALGLLTLGSLFGSWALIANRFFSSMVRIQSERGHTVVSSGPYRFVRHPGYAGGLLSWLVAPWFFSSYAVAVICLLVSLATVLRTALEDRTLLAELPGYQAYARRVRYRLLPGIW